MTEPRRPPHTRPAMPSADLQSARACRRPLRRRRRRRGGSLEDAGPGRLRLEELEQRGTSRRPKVDRVADEEPALSASTRPGTESPHDSRAPSPARSYRSTIWLTSSASPCATGSRGCSWAWPSTTVADLIQLPPTSSARNGPFVEPSTNQTRALPGKRHLAEAGWVVRVEPLRLRERPGEELPGHHGQKRSEQRRRRLRHR